MRRQLAGLPGIAACAVGCPSLSAMLQLWLDALDFGVLFCDRAGKVWGANRAALALAGWRRLPQRLLRDRGASLDGNHYQAAAVELRGELAGYAVGVWRELAPAKEARRILRAKWGASGQDVAVFLAKRGGLKTAAAAASLGMAYKTADCHLVKLYRRVGVHSYAELEARIREALAAEG